MMNLLALSPLTMESPLVTNRILPLLYEVAGRNVNVSVFSPYGRQSSFIRRYENRLKYSFLPNQHPNSMSSQKEVRLARRDIRHALRILVRPFNRLGLRISGSGELKVLIRSFTFLKDFDADLIYAFKPFLGSAGLALILGKVKKIPVMLDMDDYETTPQNPLLKKFDALTVSSRELYKLFANYDPLYIPNSTDLELFKPIPQVSSLKPIIVWSGIMYENLRLENLILALQDIRSEASLMFLGKGPLRTKLLSLTRKLVPNRVFFSPWIEREYMPHLLSKAKVGMVYLSGSIYDKCKCPGKMFEYMAMKLPVVATDVGEPRYIINKAECGILLPNNDPTSLAKAIDYLVENNEARCQMGENGRNYLLTRQNYRLLSSCLKDVILRACAH